MMTTTSLLIRLKEGYYDDEGDDGQNNNDNYDNGY